LSYRLFSWEHSYFSGKARAYLRYKAWGGDLAYEDVLATPELIQGVLIPATGSNTVPQLQTADGSFVQDTSEIIDFVERAHPAPPVVPSTASSPKQRLVSYLLELLGDEWMVVPGFWERWRYSIEEPSHLGFNEQQWGAVMAPDAPGSARREAGRAFFEGAFGISEARTNPRGVYWGLVNLGVVPETEAAWDRSHERLMGHLEAHFDAHDYVLGGLPSLGDFGLLGPLYAHHFRDATSGFALRTRTPLVAEWVERTNGEGALNARQYGQQLYSLGEGGALVGRPATSDGGAWFPDDAIPASLLPVLEVFFEEMWPVLASAMERLQAFFEAGHAAPGDELPGKTFTPTPGFEAHQTGDGALTHEFTLHGTKGRRMVLPYHVWMLQRLAAELRACRATPAGDAAVKDLLASVGGEALLELDARLAGCRVRKEAGRLLAA
jgi:glutathione S-transferase